MAGNLTSAAAIAIIVSLVDSLGATREALKEARRKLALAPSEAQLEAFRQEDLEIEAKLAEAKAKLDEWAAEDAETPTDPAPPDGVDGTTGGPGDPGTPVEPSDPAPPEEPTPDPSPTPDPDAEL